MGYIQEEIYLRKLSDSHIISGGCLFWTDLLIFIQYCLDLFLQLAYLYLHFFYLLLKSCLIFFHSYLYFLHKQFDLIWHFFLHSLEISMALVQLVFCELFLSFELYSLLFQSFTLSAFIIFCSGSLNFGKTWVKIFVDQFSPVSTMFNCQQRNY